MLNFLESPSLGEELHEGCRSMYRCPGRIPRYRHAYESAHWGVLIHRPVLTPAPEVGAKRCSAREHVARTLLYGHHLRHGLHGLGALDDYVVCSR